VQRGKRGDQPILLRTRDRFAHVRHEVWGEIMHQQQSVIGRSGEGDVRAFERLPCCIQCGLSQKAGLSSLSVAGAAGYEVSRRADSLRDKPDVFARIERNEPTFMRRAGETHRLERGPADVRNRTKECRERRGLAQRIDRIASKWIRERHSALSPTYSMNAENCGASFPTRLQSAPGRQLT